MNGLSSKASVEAEGMVAWNFIDEYGVTQRVKVRAFYVPSSGIRFFSPQYYFKATKLGNHGSFYSNTDGCIITFGNKATLTFHYSKDTGLHIAHSIQQQKMG